MRSIALALICLGFAVVCSEKARFDNYRVYSIQIENSEQLEVLKELENYQDGLLFLEAPAATRKTAEIVVPPHKFADIAELFDRFQMKTEIKTENLQRYDHDHR